jgi:nicotinamidase-related amidase
MNELQLVDRSSMIDALNRELELRPSEVAIVTIDMHRGHLDPSVATMPTSAEDAARVIANACEMLGFARALRVPIIHVKLVMRRLHTGGSETSIVPFWQAMHKIRNEQDRLTPGRRSTINEHNSAARKGTFVLKEQR